MTSRTAIAARPCCGASLELATARGSDRHASGAKDIWRLGARRVTLAREQGEGRDPKLVARVFQKEGAR